jgi:UDP-N-acetylglucosamine--N-acetylmuramyl-(pentapeptide) pyrophosphoryl-undecaprenol N-acetylglucosamine transferase
MVLAKAGAAVVLLQRELTDATLLRELSELLCDAPRRQAMAEAARSLARPGALQRIAAMVLLLAAGK